MSPPGGIDAAVYEEALADVRALRPYGTYERESEPERLPPTSGPNCGTRTGYARHRRDGEDACDECKAANSAAAWLLTNTGTSRAPQVCSPRRDST